MSETAKTAGDLAAKFAGAYVADRNDALHMARALGPAILAAILAEREACAAACEDVASDTSWRHPFDEPGPHECAAAIRSRG